MVSGRTDRPVQALPGEGTYVDAGWHDSFRNKEILILLLFSSLVVIGLDFLFFSLTLEDSYITFRYAKHFSEGYGLGAWNTAGERVEGYSSLLWTLLLGSATYLQIDVRTASKILGIVSHLLLTSVLITFPLLRNTQSGRRFDLLSNSNATVLSGMFLALYLPLAWYATSGMETLFFSTLVVLFLLSPYLPGNIFWLPFSGCLLVLTRPEGLLIACAGIGIDLLSRSRDGRSLYPSYIAAVTILITAGALLIHRLVVFNDILPNTYWAKAGGSGFLHIAFGWQYVWDWTMAHVALSILCLIAVLPWGLHAVGDWRSNWPPSLCFCLFIVIAFIAYIIKVGGDNYFAFPYWRHFLHIFPLIVLPACYSLTLVRPQSRLVQLLLLSIFVIITNLSVLTDPNGKLKETVYKQSQTYPRLDYLEHSPYYIWIKKLASKDTTIASSLGGELPFVVDAVHIDILGLSTRHIAKRGSFDPVGPQDSKTDMRWVLDQRPDIIEGFLSAADIMRGVPGEIIIRQGWRGWRQKMSIELLSSPIFQEEYLFIRNAPYQHMNRALFIRGSYLMNHPLKDQLDCVPVFQTTLGRK